MADTEDLHHESFRKALERYGVRPIPNAQGVIRMSGVSAEANWERFKKQYNFDADIAELTKAKHEIHLELLQDEASLP